MPLDRLPHTRPWRLQHEPSRVDVKRVVQQTQGDHREHQREERGDGELEAVEISAGPPSDKDEVKSQQHRPPHETEVAAVEHASPSYLIQPVSETSTMTPSGPVYLTSTLCLRSPGITPSACSTSWRRV